MVSPWDWNCNGVVEAGPARPHFRLWTAAGLRQPRCSPFPEFELRRSECFTANLRG